MPEEAESQGEAKEPRKEDKEPVQGPEPAYPYPFPPFSQRPQDPGEEGPETVPEPMTGTRVILDGLFKNFYDPRLSLEKRANYGVNAVMVAVHEFLDAEGDPYPRRQIHRHMHEVRKLFAKRRAASPAAAEKYLTDILNELAQPVALVRAAMRRAGHITDKEYEKQDVDEYGIGARLVSKEDEPNPVTLDWHEKEKEKREKAKKQGWR